jgi:hypothetical protein
MPIDNNQIYTGNNPFARLDFARLDPFAGFEPDEYKLSGGPEPEPLAEPEAKSVLKSVWCSYRGSLIVYSVDGKKVHELCGELTYEKYTEIERRSMKGITEFDGLEDYRCIACELKKC